MPLLGIQMGNSEECLHKRDAGRRPRPFVFVEGNYGGMNFIGFLG